MEDCALMSSTGGPVSAITAARLVGRNLPLVLFLAGLGFLLWPHSGGVGPVGADGEQDAGAHVPRPNGVDRSDSLNAAASLVG